MNVCGFPAEVGAGRSPLGENNLQALSLFLGLFHLPVPLEERKGIGKLAPGRGAGKPGDYVQPQAQKTEGNHAEPKGENIRGSEEIPLLMGGCGEKPPG
jgi:hypothetical protein